MRLHKYIANCGYASRRRAELLVQAGRVAVNGKVLRSLGTTIRPERDVVTVNGEEIGMPEPLTIILNKPAGIITSTHDTHDRLTVMDILPRSVRRRGVLPVGRLDQDTEGLLVLTNEGDLNHRITHPSFETEKEYIATVVGEPSARALSQLEAGVVIEGQRTAPAVVTRLGKANGHSRFRVIIHEGKKRQVRRMFSVVGHEVAHLLRTRIGALLLGELRSGEWRELSADEIRSLAGGKEASPSSS